MTEKEWLECTDPELALESLWHVIAWDEPVYDRKLRLFAVGWCRWLCEQGIMRAESNRRVMEIAEIFADQGASEEELQQAVTELLDEGVVNTTFCYSIAVEDGSEPIDESQMLEMEREVFDEYMPARSARCVSYDGWNAAMQTIYIGVGWKGRECKPVLVSLLRDVIGNPFRPHTLGSSLCTPRVTALAQSIYDDRRFEDLPILADALEEAGCQDQSILDHLRSPGPHVRGCWPLDLILGRA